MCACYLKVQKVTYIFNNPKSHMMRLLLLRLRTGIITPAEVYDVPCHVLHDTLKPQAALEPDNSHSSLAPPGIPINYKLPPA